MLNRRSLLKFGFKALGLLGLTAVAPSVALASFKEETKEKNILSGVGAKSVSAESKTAPRHYHAAPAIDLTDKGQSSHIPAGYIQGFDKSKPIPGGWVLADGKGKSQFDMRVSMPKEYCLIEKI